MAAAATATAAAATARAVVAAATATAAVVAAVRPAPAPQQTLVAAAEGVAADQIRRRRAVVDGDAIRRHEGDAAARAIEDDVVVAHVRRADHRAVVLVVEDAEASHAAPQLVGVLGRREGERDAAGKVERHRVELAHLLRRHRVAVVVGVVSRRDAAAARAPRALSPPLVAHRPVGVGRQVHERSARIDDGRAVPAARRADARAANPEVVQVDLVRRARRRVRDPIPVRRGGGQRAAHHERADVVGVAEREGVGRAGRRHQLGEERRRPSGLQVEASDAVRFLRLEHARLVRLAAEAGGHRRPPSRRIVEREGVDDDVAADRRALRVRHRVLAPRCCVTVAVRALGRRARQRLGAARSARVVARAREVVAAARAAGAREGRRARPGVDDQLKLLRRRRADAHIHRVVAKRLEVALERAAQRGEPPPPRALAVVRAEADARDRRRVAHRAKNFAHGFSHSHLECLP